jgi:hypothetical protein
MSKSVAIIQSNYIPWKGYFDIINSVDEFILYDEVQYTRSDWRNRNRIIGTSGLLWLTIPVEAKNYFHRPISSIAVADPKWHLKHCRTVQHSYARAQYYGIIFPVLERIYKSCEEIQYLSEINRLFIQEICQILGIDTKITFSSEYQIDPRLTKTERLIALCVAAGTKQYISGPSAKSYLDANQFADAGISLEYVNYDNYPPYRQLSSSFEHHVSIIDLLLNEGLGARQFMKSFQ